MNHIKIIIAFITPILFFNIQTLDARESFRIPGPDTLQRLTTHEGSVTIGRIEQITPTTILFASDIGTITIPYAKIKHITYILPETIKHGEYWVPNPNTTRLFFSPTARMLPKGGGYFSDHYIFFPAITVGITDYFTLGGGLSIFPGISMSDQVFYVTPKIGGQINDNLNLAAGTLLLSISSENETAGILYGVATYGKTDASLTLGLGYGFINGDLAARPVIMFGGEKRLTRRMTFVSENWIYPGEAPLISYGFRFFGESLSVGLAAINTLGEGFTFPGVPYLDFAINF